MPGQTKLTEHFYLDSDVDQITWSQITGIHLTPNVLQIQLHRQLAMLCEILFRKPFGVPVQVTSGQRNKAIVSALKEAGYPVSKRSDHYFMEMVDGWNGTTGAWDITMPGHEDDVALYFSRAYQKLAGDSMLREIVGQMIYYPSEGVEWKKPIIHISNSRERAFSKTVASAIKTAYPGRHKFLIKHKDGFKQYTGYDLYAINLAG